ncbi:MAG: hypothetical protein AAF355_12510 [Myxococcota bacterium]
MKNLKELSLLGLALIAFGAVGCGDDSSDTDTGDTDSGTNAGDLDSGTSNGGSNFGGEPDEFTQCTGGASYDYVLSTLVVPNATNDASSVDGFDLDGRGSVDSGLCAATDFSNKRHQDVDNALAANLNALNTFLNVNDALATTLNSGNLVIVLRLAAVDDFLNDDCVNAEIYLGATADGEAPEIDQATGAVAASQTFVLDGEAQATINAVIAGGLIQFTAPSVPLSLTFEDTRLDLSILEARLDGEITADGLIDGMIGGGLTIPNIVNLLQQLELGADFSGIISGFADVVSASGECDVLSLGAGLTGVSATIQAE